MAELKPLNDTIFLETIYTERNDILLDELKNLTQEFTKGICDASFEQSARVIEAQMDHKPQSQMGSVLALGPEVSDDIHKDDVIIFPLHAGSMVTVLDPETNKFRRVFAISEKACLARYRED